MGRQLGTHHYLDRHRPRSPRRARKYAERADNARLARRGLLEPNRLAEELQRSGRTPQIPTPLPVLIVKGSKYQVHGRRVAKCFFNKRI